MVIKQLLLPALDAVSQCDPPLVQIDPLHLRLQTHHVLENLPWRADDVGDLKVAGGHFMQHGREKEKILTAHKGYFDGWIGGERLVQVLRHVEAAKAAAKNQDPCGVLCQREQIS